MNVIDFPQKNAYAKSIMRENEKRSNSCDVHAIVATVGHVVCKLLKNCAKFGHP